MACLPPEPRPPSPVPREARNGASVKAANLSPGGLYQPRLSPTPLLSSPDHVQLSTAAAITLGLIPGHMFRCACTRCLNLLMTYPEGCRANCAYCGLARHREAERNYADRNFIRVDWPAVPLDALIDRIATETTPFERMCISMITHPRSDADTKTVLERWRRRISPDSMPVSILSNPTTMSRADISDLHHLGADIFTVALDACTEAIFDKTRGKGVQSPHSWQGYWAAFETARAIFGPDKTGMHLIVGMGETDHDVLALCDRLHRVQAHSHLFCFYPERGSLMDHCPPPPRPRWRKVQLARYLIEYAGHPFSRLRFDAEGMLASFGMDEDRLSAIIATGLPFRTSGCPGSQRPDLSACDRPYGDSPPSNIASYPFPPDHDDMALISRQLAF